MERKTLAIVIVVYNIADLITKQIECIKKYCKDSDYDIIVIDNSDIPEITEAVEFYISEIPDIKFMKTQSADHNDSQSHAFACNTSYLKLKDKYKLFFYVDHDVFPIRDFGVAEILESKVIAGLGQSKDKDYYWPGCVMFNNESIDNSLIDFSINREFLLDTGGNLYKVIEKYGKGVCGFFNEKYCENMFFRKTFYNFYATINDDMFMHFINSSNWNPIEENKERINSLLYILNGKIT